ncbi:hypothetical protein F5B20DRAFT_569050 [Whalleya microplaca]|nr:hypothetical protein F5B20DRAFT_569050 [Whalleya microplaca]
MAPTFVLVSGANRGIGKGLVANYLSKPDHIVIAANRNPDYPISKALVNLPKGTGSRLVIVKVDSIIESDPVEAVKQIEAQGIDYLDIVIANAGISTVWPKATLPLLRKSINAKWITMGFSAGWLENQYPAPNAAYAPSKTAVYWLTKRINGKEDYIAAFTDTGNTSAQAFGLKEAPVSVKDSCNGLVQLIDEATKELHGGKLWGHDGKQQAW